MHEATSICQRSQLKHVAHSPYFGNASPCAGETWCTCKVKSSKAERAACLGGHRQITGRTRSCLKKPIFGMMFGFLAQVCSYASLSDDLTPARTGPDFGE